MLLGEISQRTLLGNTRESQDALQTHTVKCVLLNYSPNIPYNREHGDYGNVYNESYVSILGFNFHTKARNVRKIK